MIVKPPSNGRELEVIARQPALEVVIDSGLRLRRSTLPPGFESHLVQVLSVPNPEHAKRVRLELPLFGVPERLYFHAADGDELRLPRGASNLLKRTAWEAGFACRFIDHRRLPTDRLPELPDVNLRPYQARAMAEMARKSQGLVVAPCGSGKTRIALGTSAKLRTPTLVLVHQKDLASQWRHQIDAVLGLEAGLVGCGKVQVEPITVAMVQTLARWEARCLDDLLARFGMLVLDEAHHVAATTFAKLVDRSPARYRFGLSATPERDDGLGALLELYIGRPVAQITHAHLAEAGVLVRPRVRTIETSFEFQLAGPEDYQPMLAELIADPKRNALVASHVVREARAGHLCLVLSTRVAHCEELASLISRAHVPAASLTGDLPPKRRAELLEAARAGKIRVLVATQLADEGLDLPELSRVFLAAPSKARGRTIQRLGRVMRSAPGKTQPELIDFVDSWVPLLRRQAHQRRQAFEEVLVMVRAA